MTLKDFKKEKQLTDFWLSYDYDIFCDMAERAGYDPTDDKMVNHYGDHQTYLEEHDIDLWGSEYIHTGDPDFAKLSRFTDDAFLVEYFFDNYIVEKSWYDNEFGLIVKIVHE